MSSPIHLELEKLILNGTLTVEQAQDAYEKLDRDALIYGTAFLDTKTGKVIDPIEAAEAQR